MRPGKTLLAAFRLIALLALLIAGTISQNSPLFVSASTLTAPPLVQPTTTNRLTPPTGASSNPASPQISPAAFAGRDEWDQSDPTLWWWYHGKSPAEINQLLNTYNARIVQIKVEQTSPTILFTVALVSNTKSYAKSWWWYYGLTAADLNNNLNANHARLIDLDAYDIGGGNIRFAAVMVPNTGSDAKAWWWYYGLTTTDISNNLSTNNARLISLNPYVTGGQTRYAVVMISNTGADARSWWWYNNINSATISNNLTQNNARLIDIKQEPLNPGTFDVVMVRDPSPAPLWWWYTDVDDTFIDRNAGRDNGRIVSIDSYLVGGQRRYAVALITNSSATIPAPKLEKNQNDPTAWWWFYNVTPAQVTQLLDANHARLVSIKIEQGPPNYKFTVAMVANTGEYHKSWFWYYNQTPAQLSNLVSTNNLRLIDMDVVDAGTGSSDPRLTAILVPNTGADAKGFWFWIGQTAADIQNHLNSEGSRLISLRPYQLYNGATRYATVEISNTGADARTFHYFTNATISQISTAIGSSERVISLAREPNGNFDAVSVNDGCPGPCTAWWWWAGISASSLSQVLAQEGSRIISIDTYYVSSTPYFNVALIDNSTAIADHVNGLLGGTDGVKGLFLKQVGGPILASINEDYVFEPASTIKVILHLYAMQKVQNGTAHLTDPINHYLWNSAGSSCPDPVTINGTETLSTTLKEMMQHSDNGRTREISDTYGITNINTNAHNIGMTSTNVNHTIGCAGPAIAHPDQLTLTDAGRLYEGVADSFLLSGTYREIFYSLMAGKEEFQQEGYDWTGLWSTDIPNIINQVAPASWTASQKQAFQNQMRLNYKAGNYKFCTSGGCATYVDHITIAGWAQVPFCTPGSATATPVKYVFGVFINNSTSDTTAGNAFNATKAELLREPIRAGIQSCTISTSYVPVTMRAMTAGW